MFVTLHPSLEGKGKAIISNSYLKWAPVSSVDCESDLDESEMKQVV